MSQVINVLTAVFLVSALIILVFNRLSHPLIPAYIFAGLMLGALIPSDEVLTLSQIGIAFLVFIFGVKTDLDRIKTVAEESLSTAAIQVTVIGAALYLLGRGLGLDQINTLYLAAAGALSSSLVGLDLVESEVKTDILHGRLSESIQLIQDILALIIITFIAAETSTRGLPEIFLYTSMVVGLALVLRKHVFPRATELTEGSSELLMLLGLSVLTGFVGIAELLEVSLVVGSFAAGLAVARFPENLEILDSIGSLKDFFAAIFFVSVGALIATPGIATLILTSAIVVSVIFLKPAVTGLSLMINGYDKRTSYLTGLSLDQVSEFALIIVIQAYIAGGIDIVVFQSVVLSAAITMTVSSYTSRHEERIYKTISKRSPIEVSSKKIKENTRIPEKLGDHVILLGYDTQGREIADALESEDQQFIIVENDPEKIVELSKQDYNYIYGDVFDQETWNKINYQDCRLIVSTIPFRDVSREVLKLDTDAEIILRSQETGEARRLLEEGAAYVDVPDIVASEELIDHLRGVMENRDYAEELRRRKLLELRRYTRDEES